MPPDRPRADVAVAVATLHRPGPLARCIGAILDGELLPSELLIVDQSADAATSHVVAGSGWERLVRVRYVRQPKRGLAASRNAAVARANAPVLAFTDDDCVPDRRWLAALMAAFDSCDRPDAVTGRILPLGPEQPGLYALSTRDSRARALHRTRALPWVVGSGGNAAIRREWLERIGGFDERLGAGSEGRSAEDLDLFYRLLRTGAAVLYEPEAIVLHERADGARRLATRPAYGFGLGACCGLWMRRRDSYALWVLTRWCADRCHGLAAACIRRRPRRLREEALMLYGAARGLVYGLTRPGRGDRGRARDGGMEGSTHMDLSCASGWSAKVGARR